MSNNSEFRPAGKLTVLLDVDGNCPLLSVMFQDGINDFSVRRVYPLDKSAGTP